ncbi:MAG: protoporphyrinogen/coproporphyrinogen oxidase [Chloroflexota bacterium]
MIQTVVVGAGPAGLAASYRLAHHPNQRVLLLERAPAPGGLAAGFRHGEHTLDFGPHRLHAGTDPQVLDDLRRLLGDELRVRPRRGRIRIDGRYLPYPIGPASILRLGLRRTVRLGIGAVAARGLRRWKRADAPPSYASALIARFGEPLYRLFYGPYAEKVWGVAGTEIAADQAEKRVNQRGVADLLRSAFGRGPGRWYYYPEGGFGRIPAAYHHALRRGELARRARVACATTVEAVEWDDRGVRAVRYAPNDGGLAEWTALDHLVWTAPLPELVRRLQPAAPLEVRCAAQRLRHRAVVLCYVVLNVPRVGTADTYYFPERRFPFNRVIEQKNFSPAMAPPDRTVLGMDLACDAGDVVFTASDEQLAALVLPALREAGLARQEQVVEVFSRRFAHGYPIYDFGYQEALTPLMDWLGRIPNLWLIGRQGLFLHNNTHHSLLMGYRAADAISLAEELAARDQSDWHAALAEFAAFRVAD